MSDYEDVKLDRLRGSAPIGRRLDLGTTTPDTEPMMAPPLRQASHHDVDMARLAEENRRRDRRLATLEAAIIGTDTRPGVYAMMLATKNDVAALRVDIKEERRERHDGERVNNIAMWVMATGMGLAAIALVVIAIMRAHG